MRIALVICFTFFSLTAYSGSNLDSLRVEVRDGQQFIVHQVESKETLFGLSKRYEVAIDAITGANPQIADGLQVGQQIMIPLSKSQATSEPLETRQHMVDMGETLYAISRNYDVSVEVLKSLNNLETNDLKVGQILLIPGTGPAYQEIPEDLPKSDTPSPSVHVVQEQETLYGISRTYGVTVEDLRDWNNLTDNNVSIGQQLIVGSGDQPQPVVLTPLEEPKAEEPTEVAVEVTEEAVDTTTTTEPKVVVPILAENVAEFNSRTVKVGDLEKVFEEGMAMVIENTTDTKKYLALHREAEVGTVMKVRNMMNELSIYVRVVGRLPDTGENDRVLLKLSRTAYERLGARDMRFPVEVSYIP